MHPKKLGSQVMSNIGSHFWTAMSRFQVDDRHALRSSTRPVTVTETGFAAGTLLRKFREELCDEEEAFPRGRVNESHRGGTGIMRVITNGRQTPITIWSRQGTTQTLTGCVVHKLVLVLQSNGS